MSFFEDIDGNTFVEKNMKLLFKINDNITIDDAKIIDTNFEEHYPTVNQNSSFKQFSVFIRQATTKYIIPFVGQSFYDKISANFNDNSLNGLENQIAILMQDCIAYYAIYEAMPHMNIIIGDAGIMQNNTEKSNSTPQWAFNKAYKAALEKADDNLDRLINFLDDNKTSLEEYDNSKESTMNVTALFKNSNELLEFLNIKGSRKTYNTLLPFIRKAEKDKVVPIICKELFMIIDARNFETPRKDLLDDILYEGKVIAANAAFYAAIPHLNVAVESDGLKIISTGDSFDNKNGINSQATINRVETLRDELLENVKTATHNLIAILYKNINQLPEWANSDCYTRTQASSPAIIKSKKGGIGLW